MSTPNARRSLKLGHKLGLAFGGTLALIALIVVVGGLSIAQMRTLQDEGAQRALDAQLSERVKLSLSRGYGVIADAVINRNLEESRRDWSDVTRQLRDELAELDQRVDTAEERASLATARAAAEDFIRTYEGEMLPILAGGSGVPPEIRQVDDKLDGHLARAIAPLDTIITSLNQESVATDKKFDENGQQTQVVNWVLSLLALVGVVA